MQRLTSAARAEAMTIVLRLLLSRLSRDELRRLKRQAEPEVEAIGLKSIRKEMKWLFHG